MIGITNLSKDRIKSILYNKYKNIYKDSIENPHHSTFCLELFEKENLETYSIEYLVGIANGAVLLISEPLTLDLNELQADDSEIQHYLLFYENIYKEAHRLVYLANKHFNSSIQLSSTDGILRCHVYLKTPSEYSLNNHLNAMQSFLDDLFLYESSGW